MTQANICYQNAIYHICSRGRDRKFIFLEAEDYSYFLKILKTASEKYNTYIHAYCLLDNHYHLIIQTPYANISKTMKFINESYAKYFVKKYKEIHDGCVFARRYRRQIVEDLYYLKTLFVYVKFNSFRHNQSIKPNLWPYSSYRVINGDFNQNFIKQDLFHQSFGNINNFHSFALSFDYGWTPDKNAVAGLVLAEEKRARNILKQHVNFQNSNISNIQEIKSIVIKGEIDQHIQTLKIDQPLKDMIHIYLLREYTSFTRGEIAQEFEISPNTVSKRWNKVKRLINENNFVAEIVETDFGGYLEMSG